jgi:two-component system nitrate/nitrite response regulator NarL
MIEYRVVLAEDHPMARRAIRSLLNEDEAFILIGEATNGKEAIQLTEESQPDVILMDINMPEMNGLEATRIIKQRYPNTKIVILTVSDDVADLFSAIQYGAQGYLLKNMDPDDWISYLHALLGEDKEVSRKMADRLFHQFKTEKHIEQPEIQVLTSREQEILSLVAAGENNRQIANHLIISENTVKNHIKNILYKLSLENRVQLTAYAVRNGLTQNVQSNGEK